MDDSSVEEIDLFSGTVTSRDSNGYTMQLPRECLTIYLVNTTWYVIRPFLLCRVEALHPVQMI